MPINIIDIQLERKYRIKDVNVIYILLDVTKKMTHYNNSTYTYII